MSLAWRFDEDAIREARREEAMDRFDEITWTCRDCQESWDPRRHGSSRTDPAYVEVDACPYCGGPPVES